MFATTNPEILNVVATNPDLTAANRCLIQMLQMLFLKNTAVADAINANPAVSDALLNTQN